MKITRFIITCATIGLTCAVMDLSVSAGELSIKLPDELQDPTAALCKQYGVDYDVVVAIAWHESGCNPTIEDSSTHDRGIMQINRVNWEWLLDDYGLDVNEPEQNIEAAILILSMFMENYTLEESLAAYAAGESGMLQGRGKWFAEKILEGWANA